MSIIYMNADVVFEAATKRLATREATSGEHIDTVVLNMSGVNYMDAAGVEALLQFEKVLADRACRLAFFNVKFPVRTNLFHHGVLPRLTLYQNLAAVRSDLTHTEGNANG